MTMSKHVYNKIVYRLFQMYYIYIKPNSSAIIIMIIDYRRCEQRGSTPRQVEATTMFINDLSLSSSIYIHTDAVR